MSESIKPALTPAQWREALSSPPGRIWGFGAETSGELSAHTMAAIALYGQPFGFTREDVEALDLVLGWAWSHADEYLTHGKWERITKDAFDRVESVDARIRALLPPEDLK